MASLIGGKNASQDTFFVEMTYKRLRGKDPSENKVTVEKAN